MIERSGWCAIASRRVKPTEAVVAIPRCRIDLENQAEGHGTPCAETAQTCQCTEPDMTRSNFTRDHIPQMTSRTWLSAPNHAVCTDGISVAGLGLRRAFAAEVLKTAPTVDFYEVAPENWMRIGGNLGRQFRALTERFPFVAHGLSLSLGGPAPLDRMFLGELKRFLDVHRITLYSEHLSFCGDDGLLYDLMPIPFTKEAATYVAGRIRQVQEILDRRIAIENVSTYAMPAKEMEEIDFLNTVLQLADCDLLLDINNIWVNSVNHRYDPEDFLKRIPGHRIAYAHIAGHFQQSPHLLVDTHGSDVIEPVWNLLGSAYRHFGVFPTLLERDFNIPPLADLISEVERIRTVQRRLAERSADV
jgi:hypothetical protein